MNADIKQELAALRARIDELEAQAKADSWPKDGDKCWMLDSDGYPDDFYWGGDDLHMQRLEIGNCYRTREEAEHEVERSKVLTELRRLAKANRAIDWVNTTQCKYRLVYEYRDRIWVVAANQIERAQGAVYFDTEQAAKAAIETIGANRLMLLCEE